MKAKYLLFAILLAPSALPAEWKVLDLRCAETGDCRQRNQQDQQPQPQLLPQPQPLEMPKNIDYQCLNDCTRHNYMYEYCVSRCSY